MRLKNKELWENQKEINSDDPYSKGVITFAERWMNLMEKGLETGLELKHIWEACSRQADTEGITGFMYGAATSIIAQVWEHGEELRKLHNAKYNQPDAKGTVNPAIITVEVPDDMSDEEFAELLAERARAAGFVVEKDMKKLE